MNNKTLKSLISSLTRENILHDTQKFPQKSSNTSHKQLSEIAAGQNYTHKENLKNQIQSLLESAISNDLVSSQKDLDDWWKTIDMISNTLKNIPLQVWLSKLQINK